MRLARRVLRQHELIARTREVCLRDPGLTAALTYGSFAAGEGDAHSDVEFWLFFAPEGAAGVDPAEWCGRIAPVNLLVRNEFGTDVAFFDDLVRGEFHFATTRDIERLSEWPARGAPVERMVVKDRTGALEAALRALPRDPVLPASRAEAEAVCGRFANWLVLAHHVAARGERLRAWDALGHVQRHLLWMVRLTEDRTAHWLTPSRAAESDLPPAAVRALREATCAAGPEALSRALRAAWREGRRRWLELLRRYGGSVPEAVFRELDAALGCDRDDGAAGPTMEW